MNAHDLHEWAELSPHCSHTLSFEHFFLPYHSLRALHVQNHFDGTFYWGRLLGTHADYYVAFGYRGDILKDSKFFYSNDGVFWNLMPSVTEMTINLTLNCTSRIRGDPHFTVEVGDGAPEMDEHGFFNPEGALKEEDRLAATVWMITEDAAVVPRGALYRSYDHIVIENPMFRGLSPLEAQHLLNYYHMRPPHEKFNTRLLSSSDNNFEFDFLDSVDMDVPQEMWELKVQLHDFEELVILRSYLWPGMTILHSPRTPRHAFFYVGDGKKNVDVPFMMDMAAAIQADDTEETSAVTNAVAA